MISERPGRRVVLSGTAASLVTASTAAAEVDRIDLEKVHFTPALTGGGPPSRWALVDDEGRKVLAQTSADRTDYRFPLAIFDRPVAADLDITLRFKPVAGEVDRAAGVAFRLSDANNYYVVRANALEDNVRLYRMVAGRRSQFAGADIKVASGSWQELRVSARGERFEVFFEGKSLYVARDKTFTAAGKVALWTKADSVTRFGDLTITTF